jgi:uncharacterized protein
MGEGAWLKSSAGRLLVEVKAIPGASRSVVAGLRDGALLVRVAAPPEKGRANEELVSCLAKALGIPKSSIELVAGATSRRKKLSLPVEAEAALRLLAAPRPPD